MVNEIDFFVFVDILYAAEELCAGHDCSQSVLHRSMAILYERIIRNGNLWSGVILDLYCLAPIELLKSICPMRG